MKQKISLNQKYILYLSEGPKPESKQSNKYNIFDDLNSKDETIIRKTRDYLRFVRSANKGGSKSAQSIKEKIMSKDRGRKAIKKPKQTKTKV